MVRAGAPPLLARVLHWRLAWAALFALALAALLIRNLVGLHHSPPGLYLDEASIGYNAWSIFHYGVDEHGAHLPLYFTAFGEYKNPVYIYAAAPFVGIFGLNPVAIRLPAAAFGLVAALAMGEFAWQVTKSKALTLCALVISGCTPWLVLESRLGFEVISMVTAIAVGLWCISRALDRGGTGWYLASGLAFAIAVFAYSTGRLAVLLFTISLVLACAGTRTKRYVKWWAVLVPTLCAYLGLAIWSQYHPGALAARFDAISITSGHPGLLTLIGRFAGNYAAYWDPRYFWWNGDGNLRHSTGFEGMLLVAAAPLLLAGIFYCWKHRGEVLPRFVLLSAIAAPVGAAFTMEGTPHSLRDAPALPFLLALCIYGLIVVQKLRIRPWLMMIWVGVAALEISAYHADLFTAYPIRSFDAFNSAYIPALTEAHDLADGHRIWLSGAVDRAYIEAFALYPPVPPRRYSSDLGDTRGLAQLRMQIFNASNPPAMRPGDIAVLWYTDPLPKGAVPVAEFSVPAGAGEGGFVLLRPAVEIRVARIG